MDVTIDKFGRVLIPKPIRSQLGLQPGTPLTLTVSGRALQLRRVDEEPPLANEGRVVVYTGTAAGDLTLPRRDA